MKLSQLECTLPRPIAEELSTMIEEEAPSISLFEGKGDEWVFQIVCKESEQSHLRELVTHFLKEREISLSALTVKELPQTDWVAAVYKELSPLTIGRFFVHGSHFQGEFPKDLIPLCIDAATAFGSGQHESTEGCLKALSQLSRDHTFKHPLDMGCGSGILVFAMARLWNTKVSAYDNDVEAVRVTLENAALNHVASQITAKVSEGFEHVHSKDLDLITANILAGPLIQMAPNMVKCLSESGYIVLAGLLNTQAEDVIDAYRAQGMRLVDQLLIGEWSTLIMRKA